MTLRPKAVKSTVAASAPPDFALVSTLVISLSRNPACSMIAPKPSAPRISQTVVNIPLMPPREKSESMAGIPVAETNPVAIAA
jgi:hypothetical protein